jgi:uncharacterized protein (DUF427 family)
MSDDHPITIRPADGRVVVRWRGRTVVDTTRALELNEHTYPAVLYVPRADADMSLLTRSTHETKCPYKGVANYFSLSDGVETDANSIWTYESPIPGVAEIKDHLAFYPNRVQISRESK